MQIRYTPMNIKEEIQISKSNPDYVKKEYSLFRNKLVCIGVNHTGNLEHLQFKILKEMINKNNFSRIILEISPSQLKEYHQTNKKELFKEKDVVIKLSEKNKIPLIPGDMDIKDILFRNSRKYGEKNILLLRVLIYLNGKVDFEKNLSKIIEHLETKDKFKKIFKNFKKKEKINNDKFKKIVREFILINNEKRIDEITNKDYILPSPLENKTELNKIMKDISYKRDKYMIKIILKNAKKGNILFIVGKNHVIRHEPYFRNMEKD